MADNISLTLELDALKDEVADVNRLRGELVLATAARDNRIAKLRAKPHRLPYRTLMQITGLSRERLVRIVT